MTPITKPFVVVTTFIKDPGSGVFHIPAISERGSLEVFLTGLVEEEVPWQKVMEERALQKFHEQTGLKALGYEFYPLQKSGKLHEYGLVRMTSGKIPTDEIPVSSNDGQPKVMRLQEISYFMDHVHDPQHRGAFIKAGIKMCILNQSFGSQNATIFLKRPQAVPPV